MSNIDENNSHSNITNNSAKNVSYYSHQKNKSFNFLSDPPSAVITVQLNSPNSNQNSKSKEKNNKSSKNIYNEKVVNIKNNIKESKTEPEKKEEGHIYSYNSNSKDSNTNTNIIINNKKKESSNSYSSTKLELEKNCKDLNNYRLKLSKINEQYSTNTPKQLSSVHKVIVEGEGDQGNILVKKNMKLGSQRSKNSLDNKDRINENKNNRNDNNKQRTN